MDLNPTIAVLNLLFTGYFTGYPSATMTNETTFITVSQTDTKSYMFEKITLLYTRHFTGHPPAMMTSEVTFTIPNQTDANFYICKVRCGQRLNYPLKFTLQSVFFNYPNYKRLNIYDQCWQVKGPHFSTCIESFQMGVTI